MDERVKITCIEMLEQRGYSIEEDTKEKIIGVKDDDRIYIILKSSPKLNIEKITEYIMILRECGISHAIIMYKDDITPIAKKMITDLTDLHIEIFCESELYYNITKHYLVPKHEPLSREDSTTLKSRYGSKFPIILQSDPVSKFYNFKRGNIVRITRNNNYVTYRIVV